MGGGTLYSENRFDSLNLKLLRSRWSQNYNHPEEGAVLHTVQQPYSCRIKTNGNTHTAPLSVFINVPAASDPVVFLSAVSFYLVVLVLLHVKRLKVEEAVLQSLKQQNKRLTIKCILQTFTL